MAVVEVMPFNQCSRRHGEPTTPSTPPEESGQRDRLRRLQDRFSAFDAISEGVSVVDKDLTLVFVNKRLRAEVGNVVGKKCYDTPLKSDEICTNCPVKLDWDYEKGPYVRLAADGLGHTLEIQVTKLDDSGEEFWVARENDLTEQVLAETRLRMLSASMDQMAEPLCVADLDGRLVYTNKAYAALTGYDERHIAGLSMTESGRHGEGATMEAVMKAAAVRGWQGEMTGLRKDGTRYYTHVAAKPVKGEAGETLGVVGLLQDVTKQKTERVEFEKYTSELEAKMEARTTELARKVSQLTTINKISRVVTSILDLDELIDEFVKSIAQGFGYQHVTMMMSDKDRGDLYFKAGYGWHMDSVPKDMRIQLKEGVIGHAAYFGETLVSGDVASDPRYIRRDLVGTKSELAVPVTFHGEIIGVLDVQSDIRDAFTRNDVSMLEMLADMLATSITNARVYSESKEREAALSVLDKISKQISYRLEPAVVLDQVARDAANLLRAEKAMVGLVDQATRMVNWVAPYKIDKEKLKGQKFSAENGVSGRALKLLKTEVVNDYLSDPDAIERDAELFEIDSMVSAPLMIEGRGIGIINVYNKQGGKQFTKSDALFLSSLADHAAIALENANLLSSLNQRVHSQLALLDTALSMQRQLDSGSIYDLVADRLRNVVSYDALTFYRVDHDRGVVSPVTARGPYFEEIMSESFPISEGIIGSVIKSGKAELVADTRNDSRGIVVSGTVRGGVESEECMMAIPLRGKDRVIGVLAMYRDHGTRFSATELEIAQLFASQASVAIENADLYGTREALLSESRRKVEQMAKVLDLTSSVMYMDDLDRLLQRITDTIVQSFGFRRSSICVLNVEEDVLTIKARTGYPPWAMKGYSRPLRSAMEDFDESYKVGATSYYLKYENQKFGIEEFAFLAHPELASKPRAAPDAWHERDVLMCALKDRSGKLIGHITVDEPNDLKVPTADHIEVLEILAGIASIALENAKLYERQVAAANEIALMNDLMTHDINNFNQGIMGYIELLLEDKRLDDNQRRYAERALFQVRNNARLIDNIRKLAKVRIMGDADFVPMDIQGSVSQAIENVTKMFPDKKISVVSSLSPKSHYVLANLFLEDLFFNIISNAVKFDVSRRVRIDVMVDEESSPQGDFWIVSVADRGRGIPDDRKKVVFERFATGMTGIKGFGLGLSIVSAIVDKLGGRIWVEDRVKGDFSKGTVFKIQLPKASIPANSEKTDAGRNPEEISTSSS